MFMSHRIKSHVVRSLVAMAALLIAMTGAQALAQSKPAKVSISAANPGAPWGIIGASFSQIMNQQGVKSNVELGGALSNVVTVSDGRTQLGFTAAAVIPLAQQGQKPFPRKIDNVRAIAAVMTNATHILVTNESGVKSLKDLKGRRFVSQPVGNVSQYAFQLILESQGLKESDLQLMRGGQRFGADTVKNRKATGFTATAVFPAGNFANAFRSVPSNFLDIDEETFKYVNGKNPGLFRLSIPANTYEGQTKPIRTVATRALLIVRDDMPEEHAYWLTKTLVENLPTLRKSHKAVRRLDLNIMANPPALPLHAGAKRYYTEAGTLK